MSTADLQFEVGEGWLCSAVLVEAWDIQECPQAGLAEIANGDAPH